MLLEHSLERDEAQLQFGNVHTPGCDDDDDTVANLVFVRGIIMPALVGKAVFIDLFGFASIPFK